MWWRQALMWWRQTMRRRRAGLLSFKFFHADGCCWYEELRPISIHALFFYGMDQTHGARAKELSREVPSCRCSSRSNGFPTAFGRGAQ